MKKQAINLLLIGMLGFSAMLAANAVQPAQSNATDTTVARPQEDNSSAIVVLKEAPLSTSVKTKPAQGKKIDFNSATVKAYRATLNTGRNNFKKWLAANAPKANVTGNFDISLNAVAVALNGTSLETIKACPLVQDAQYQTLYYPTTDDPDLELIKAVEAWQVAGGPANAGQEVKVAIIDTGIDIHHPCFSDAGYPPATKLGDPRFTNNKVIAAKVFNNKASKGGFTAEAIQEHGTHVSGTVACNYNTAAVVNGVTIPHGISGVAPRALLGNYNVFPGNVGNAHSEDILNALEAAYEDGFDIANMSLGGRPKSGRLGFQDLLIVAVNNLDQADMVIAIAAGNSGPGYTTIESPGAAERALTAGASTVPHYIATPVTVNDQSYGAAAGDFAGVTADLTAPLGLVLDSGSLGLGCAALPAGSLAGKIALISRGACSFSTKIRNAQNAGAVAALIVNNVAGDPVGMAQDGTPGQPTIPAYMLGRDDGLAIAGLDGASTTIGASLAYFITANADFMAGFSSQGPTDVEARIKPDVVAPGVNVLSSIPVAYCGGSPCWAFFQGTSMATPHLAGSAAVVHGLYPEWSAAQVRSAIVNTADRTVLRKASNGAPQRDVNIVGSGRENLLAAVNAKVTLEPVSVSFGAVPSGSGQASTANITLSNVSQSTSTLSLAVGVGDSSVAYSVTPGSVTLGAGQSATITVNMSAVKGALTGGHQSTLTVSAGGSEVAHAAVYTLIK
ncbi:MAG: minor extracellular serine protease Vpr [Verrucomicrobiota bacterium]